MENCFEHTQINENKNIICHYSEITHWEIIDFQSFKAYIPILRNGQGLFPMTEEEGGKEELEKYFAYKNKL
jgi:hypothetical protein